MGKRLIRLLAKIDDGNWTQANYGNYVKKLFTINTKTHNSFNNKTYEIKFKYECRDIIMQGKKKSCEFNTRLLLIFCSHCVCPLTRTGAKLCIPIELVMVMIHN